MLYNTILTSCRVSKTSKARPNFVAVFIGAFVSELTTVTDYPSNSLYRVTWENSEDYGNWATISKHPILVSCEITHILTFLSGLPKENSFLIAVATLTGSVFISGKRDLVLELFCERHVKIWCMLFTQDYVKLVLTLTTHSGLWHDKRFFLYKIHSPLFAIYKWQPVEIRPEA